MILMTLTTCRGCSSTMRPAESDHAALKAVMRVTQVLLQSEFFAHKVCCSYHKHLLETVQRMLQDLRRNRQSHCQVRPGFVTQSAASARAPTTPP